MSGYATPGALGGEMLVMSLDFRRKTELYQGINDHGQQIVPAAAKHLVEISEVILSMRGKAQYPGHPYHISKGADQSAQARARALAATIDQHWYEQNPKARRGWSRRRRTEPMSLGAETQAEAMRLALGSHLLAIETTAFEDPILAYGYVPGVHEQSRRSGFYIAEIAIAQSTHGATWNSRTASAAAAIMNHVVVSHSVHPLHPRKPGRPIGAHIAGNFGAPDSRNALIEAGFDSIDVAACGLDLFARNSTLVSQHLTEAYDLTATRSVNLAQNS